MINPKLSIVVPCYNEEIRLKSGFDHYLNYLKKQKYQWELIIVDDGSTDKTYDLMKSLAKNIPNVKLISYQPNKGKGQAIVKGVLSAKGEYILFTDIDHSVPIETIEIFFSYFEKGYEVVIGSRRVKGAKLIVHQSFLRETLGRGFTFLVRLLIDWKVRDATCGFKAFENKTAKKVFEKITIFSWAFDAEILYICKKFSIGIAQAPVTWSDVRGSKVSLKKDIFRSFFGLLKIRIYDLQGKYL